LCVFVFLVFCSSLVISVKADLEYGLILYYKLDAEEGSLADDYSIFNHTGTVTNAEYITGKFGNALYFNGINGEGSSVYTVGSENLVLGTNDFSLSFWIYRYEDFKNYIGIAVKSSYNIGLYGTAYPAYFLEFGSNPNWQTWVMDNTASLSETGRWEHLCLLIDRDGYLTSYINGVLADHDLTTLNEATSLDSEDFGFGYFWADNGNIALDEIRVYNRLLSTTEVLELYNYSDLSTTDVLGVSFVLILIFFSVAIGLGVSKR
jgi:hypothetical protein